MGDTDATQEQRDVAADVDEIIGHVINANMLNMPYDVYSELFDAVDGLGVEIENLQSENAKLREFAEKIIDSQIPSVHPTYEEAIAEYVGKFRLADDGEEQ